jgi:hypothetical protein
MIVTITRDITVAPDHLHPRLYQAGEQYEVGSALMPEGLAELLSHDMPMGYDSGFISNEQATIEKPYAHIDNKANSPEHLAEVQAKHTARHYEYNGGHELSPW